MKLTVEIKDGLYEASYKVGENTMTATSPLHAEMLCTFTDLLKLAIQAARIEDKERERELIARAWIEKQEKAKKP